MASHYQHGDDHAGEVRQAAAVRSDERDQGRAQEAQGIRQEADADQGGEGISPQVGLPATKERPSALDGYERAKPGEPIFTLQGGDPLGVEMTKLYIDKRRRRALDMEPGREQDAELVRCSEAERTLWAMQEYLRSGKQRELQSSEEQPTEPEAIDLFDYRVRAAQRISNMRCELLEIDNELERRGYVSVTMGMDLRDAADDLKRINEVLEPRRMMK